MSIDGSDKCVDKEQAGRKVLKAAGIDALPVEERLVAKFPIIDLPEFWRTFGWIALFYCTSAPGAHRDIEYRKERRSLLKSKIQQIDAAIQGIEAVLTDLDSVPNTWLELCPLHPEEAGFNDGWKDELLLGNPDYPGSMIKCKRVLPNCQRDLLELKQHYEAVEGSIVINGRPPKYTLLAELVGKLIGLYETVTGKRFRANYVAQQQDLDRFIKEGERFVAEAVRLIEPGVDAARINTAIKDAKSQLAENNKLSEK